MTNNASLLQRRSEAVPRGIATAMSIFAANPFMSGFGGITIAMVPNGATWYNIADDGQLPSIDFAKPAIEVAKLGGYCVTD